MNYRNAGMLFAWCGILAACAGGHRAQDLATYDLHGIKPMPEAKAAAPAMALRLEVRMAGWFDTTDINYRLSYESPTRLRQYADSRWAARAGQLVGERLQSMVGPVTSTAKCTLRVEVIEFSQHFEAPALSRFVLDARWSVNNAKGERLHAESRTFSVEAATADAIGGVKAAGQASGQLGVVMLAGAHLLDECK